MFFRLHKLHAEFIWFEISSSTPTRHKKHLDLEHPDFTSADYSLLLIFLTFKKANKVKQKCEFDQIERITKVRFTTESKKCK